LYQQLGVQEYFLFDPLDEYLEPRLQGFTLVNGRYKKLKPVAKDTLLSSELGRLLRAEDDILRLVNATTGKVIPNSREAMRYAEFETYLADFEAQRADSETRRADVAEANAMRLQAEVEAKATQLQAEIARLQAELVRLRGQK
jgi:Uma2 family endonuclease